MEPAPAATTEPPAPPVHDEHATLPFPRVAGVPDRPRRRLVIVVRADPVICGHSGEARCLAEVALTRGYDDVRIVTWPLDRLQDSGLPLKPWDSVQPYSPGITVERPDPVGDYRVVDGRYLAGLTGRLIELFTEGVPTVAISLYLSPHTGAVQDAARIARSMGVTDLVTVAEAVGSDITNVVRDCLDSGRSGAAVQILSTYLDADHCVAVSEFTKDLVVESAERLDAALGTRFAPECRERIGISFPAVHAAPYLDQDPDQVARVLARRGLQPGSYLLFLSRLAAAKGVDDLIEAFSSCRASERLRLVLVGRGPREQDIRVWAAESGVADRIEILTDVDDDEKTALMAGSAAFVLPSRPQPEFVETFGIALVEAMLSGGGPVITCPTGGIVEAVGDTAVLVPPRDPQRLAEAIDQVAGWSTATTDRWRARAREHALQFDRAQVFDRLARRIATADEVVA